MALVRSSKTSVLVAVAIAPCAEQSTGQTCRLSSPNSDCRHRLKVLGRILQIALPACVAGSTSSSVALKEHDQQSHGRSRIPARYASGSILTKQIKMSSTRGFTLLETGARGTVAGRASHVQTLVLRAGPLNDRPSRPGLPDEHSKSCLLA